jgi:DNA-binding CsgD family transcriptional regulator
VVTGHDGGGMSERDRTLSATVLKSVLDELPLAILIFRRERLIYTNPPATRLINRLRTKYRIELLVMLLDHLAQSREGSRRAGAVIALTGQDNEPFVVHVMELRGRRGEVAVSIREIGTDLPAFKVRYRLSRRETQVAELVLRGHRNSHIATALGITPATTKKHLYKIFEKVSVHSRAQLASKLA